MSKRSKKGMRRERTTFEWAILAVSVAAIVAIAGGLITYSLSFDSGPPDLRVDVRPEGAARNRFVVTVDNRGGTTAVEVLVIVRRGAGVQEIEFRAIPKGDMEEAIVTLGGRGRPMARVASFKEP